MRNLSLIYVLLLVLLGCDIQAEYLDSRGENTIMKFHQCPCTEWPQWQGFKNFALTDTGRIIDHSDERKITTSEGQAYALLFSLIANEPDVFAKILNWTQKNLAQGDLAVNLPAWLWGKRENGWGIIDPNAASDADLWIAYSLIQAGKLWHIPEYSKLGKSLGAKIIESETTLIPYLGLTLLPAPFGFITKNNTSNKVISWKLNPSYSPIQIINSLAINTNNTAWVELLNTSKKLLLTTSNNGFSADWVIFEKENKAFQLNEEIAWGSYDAIRVYLWVGMLHPDEPFKAQLLTKLYGITQSLGKMAKPPLKSNSFSGETQEFGPSGFSAALLPLLDTTDKVLLEQQLQVLNTRPVDQKTHGYYDQVLNLFGLGWVEKRYHFDLNGDLIPIWASEQTQ